MALGGDPPTDPDAGAGELPHASELVELARAIGGFSVGVAAQPDGHPLSPDLATDRDHLAAKLALADFAVTQFFFEASEYTALVADLAERGVDKPVLPGIMPVDQPVVGAPDGPHGRGGARRGWSRGWRRPTRRGGAEAVRHEGVAVRHRAVRGAAGRRRARPALLHAQPVERDPGDLLGAGPRPRLRTEAGSDRRAQPRPEAERAAGEPGDPGVGAQLPRRGGRSRRPRSADRIAAPGGVVGDTWATGRPVASASRRQNAAHRRRCSSASSSAVRASPSKATSGSVSWMRGVG